MLHLSGNIEIFVEVALVILQLIAVPLFSSTKYIYIYIYIYIGI